MATATAALDGWRLIRRYAVPEWMIDACTRARERGDWRAACEAARVTVAVDDTGRVAQLLAGFAPDLLRWHLPREMDGTGAAALGMRFVMAPDGPVTADTVVLGFRTASWVSGSQRLTLRAVRVGDIAPGPVYPLPPYLWDARRAGELRVAAHGSATRLPGFTPAGEPLPVDEFGAGEDEPARVERIRATAGAAEAWVDAGWLINDTAAGGWKRSEIDLLRSVDPRRAAQELRRVAAQFGRECWELRADFHGRNARWREPRRLRLELVGDRHQITRGAAAPSPSGPIQADLRLHPALLRPPVDLDLIRHGRMGVGDLHPLVRSALFPSAPAAATRLVRDSSFVPAGFAEGEEVRVRCGADWHRIGLRGGRFALLDHTDTERRRELALRAFGGAIRGCFQAEIAWHGGGGVPPRRLREFRRDLWRRMQHGGARAVIALLDAGMDPHVRDGLGRTLLHRIHQFEHAELLPRLLAEGVDVNAVCRRGFTAMCEALVHEAPADLIMALNEAGAYPQLSLLDPRSWPVPVDPGSRPERPVTSE